MELINTMQQMQTEIDVIRGALKHTKAHIDQMLMALNDLDQKIEDELENPKPEE